MLSSVDPVKVAAMQEEDVERLVQDAGLSAIVGKFRQLLVMRGRTSNGTERRTVCRLCLVVCQSSPQVTQATTLSEIPTSTLASEPYLKH